MTKKCVGCGVVLQDTDKEKLGYTPNLKNDYCMRCFRLKNYGEKKNDEVVDEKYIINKVNKGRGLVFFLVDFLNINKYSLDIFKRIKLPKVLVISKSDTLRRDMKFTKIKRWLNKVYDVKEEVLFISNRNDFRSANIFNYMDKLGFKTSYIMGITNAGKSTLINSILKKNNIKKEIVISDKPNTTLDFIKLHVGEYVIYDTPGFDYQNSKEVINKEIKPVSINITKETTISIKGGIDFYFDKPNKITLYLTHNSVKRKFKDTIKNGKYIDVFDNGDIIIPGVGFINVKNACKVKSIIEVLEVRPNISGEDYE